MAKMNYTKAWCAVYIGDRLPRKTKKAIFGKRISKTKLRAALANVEYKNGKLVSIPFCPKCGCETSRGTGNMVAYPEHWENFYCLRCNEFVGSIDNSRFIHILEYEKYRALTF